MFILICKKQQVRLSIPAKWMSDMACKIYILHDTVDVTVWCSFLSGLSYSLFAETSSHSAAIVHAAATTANG